MTCTYISAETRARWLAVSSVALGTFTLVTSEMMPVGLLTSIGATLGVSDGTAGLMMTAPALVAAVSAPALVLATRRLDRRATLIGLMALLAVANFTAALAPGFAVILAARVLTGVSIGGFWTFASSLAPRLVPGPSVGRATSIIVGGVSMASVLGVPLATFISAYAGWRAMFVAMGVAALALIPVLATALPSMPGEPPAREAAPRRTRWLSGPPLLLLVVWGLGYGGMGVTLQLWIMRAGGGEMGTALFICAFNASIALGSFAGGQVADGLSISAVMWLGTALAVLSAVAAGVWGRGDPADS